MKVLTYLIYVIFWEALTIGGCAYLVFWQGQHGAWFILAVVLSSMGYSPSKWNDMFTPKS